MLALLRVQLLHVYRNRLIVLGILAGLLFEFAGLHVLHNLTLSFQNVVSELGWKQSLFVAFFLQLFSGFFVSAAAGIWLLPYPHQGLRAVLTYITPISPFSIAGAQLALIFLLLGLQFSLGLGVFAFSSGLEPFRTGEFPWRGALTCFALAGLAGSTLAFWLAAISMRLGAVAAFLMSAFVLTTLQIYGTLLRIGSSQSLEQFAEVFDRWRTLYRFLPPFGDLIFNLRDTLFKTAETVEASQPVSWLGWAAWLVLGVLAFTFSQKAQLNRRSVA